MEDFNNNVNFVKIHFRMPLLTDLLISGNLALAFHHQFCILVVTPLHLNLHSLAVAQLFQCSDYKNTPIVHPLGKSQFATILKLLCKTG